MFITIHSYYNTVQYMVSKTYSTLVIIISCIINISLSQLLGMLLRSKSHLVNSNILHLTYTLVGTVDSEHESARIPNIIAFKDLLAG